MTVSRSSATGRQSVLPGRRKPPPIWSCAKCRSHAPGRDGSAKPTAPQLPRRWPSRTKDQSNPQTPASRSPCARAKFWGWPVWWALAGPRFCAPCSGPIPAKAGTIRIAGAEAAIKSPADAIRLGMAFVTEDRRARG